MLLSSSSSRSSRGARTTQCTIPAPGASAPKLIGAETAGSAAEEVPSLRDLIDQHSTAFQVGRKTKARPLAIIKYKPTGDEEANLKLTYLASYLIATRSTLTARELNLISNTLRNSPRA